MLESDGETPQGNIIACSDVIDGVSYRPQTLGEVGFERITGRKVTGWSASLGSYGMGGPGFFGLNLAAQRCIPGRVAGAASVGRGLLVVAGRPVDRGAPEPVSRAGAALQQLRPRRRLGSRYRQGRRSNIALGERRGWVTRYFIWKALRPTGWKCPKIHRCYPCMAGQCSPAYGNLTKNRLTPGLFLMATCGCRSRRDLAVTCAFNQQVWKPTAGFAADYNRIIAALVLKEK